MASLLVGNWDLRIEEYISAPYRPAQTRGKPCPARHSRLRVSWLTDAKLRTPRLDVAGDWKGDCARFIRCRLSVMEVYNMLSFLLFGAIWYAKSFAATKKKKSLSELSVITNTVRGFTKKKSGKWTGKKKDDLFHPTWSPIG